MVKSKPTAAQLKATGNASLYRGLASRKQPVYLRRNLDLILDEHQRQLLNTMSAEPNLGQIPSTTKDAQLKAWCKTSTQALRRFVEMHHEYKNRPPRLKVTRLAILCPNHDTPLATQVATPSATPDDHADSNDDPDPDWLVNSGDSAALVPCKGIISGRSDVIRPQTFSGDLKFKHEQWILQLNQPLLIDLFASPAQWATAYDDVVDEIEGSPPLVIKGKVSLEIKIFTKDNIFSALSVGPSHSSKQVALNHHIEEQMLKDMGSRATVLCSTAVEIKPRLSASYRPMLDNHDTLAMDLQLLWDHDLSTTLESFYQHTAVVMGDTQSGRCHLPTPSRDPNDRTETEVIFIFQERTQYTQTSFTCPLCDTSYDYKLFQRLHLHLLLHHDHFHYDVEKKDDDRIFRRIVRFDLGERRAGRANIKGNDALKIDWVAPNRPFDVDAHLNGDTTWIGDDDPANTRTSTRIRRGRGRPPLKTKSSSSSQRRAPVTESQHKRLPPEEVPELVPRRRTAHPVPAVVDSEGRSITFFRTNSKRPFETGEMIEDSDEDVDDSWIRERRRQNLAKLVLKDRKLSHARARFMADWDTHIDYEEHNGVSGDTLKREGVFRFAKKFVAQMDDEEYLKAWKRKLLRLQKYNILDQTDLQYCYGLLNNERVVDEPNDSTVAGAETPHDSAPINQAIPQLDGASNEASSTQLAELLASRGNEWLQPGKTHARIPTSGMQFNKDVSAYLDGTNEVDKARHDCIQT